MIDHYDWPGGREAMLRFGPDDGPVVVVAMPLFEEANRTRAFVVAICRSLAERGIGSVLPDLPGQGESAAALTDVSLDDWRAAYAAAVRAVGPAYAVALRGGALVDHDAAVRGRHHIAPATGKALAGEMLRAAYVAALPNRIDFRLHAVPDGPPIGLAGNLISRKLLIALEGASPSIAAPIRTIRLADDGGRADRKVTASPLWRRAEPGNDPALAALLADDIAAWMATCGG